MRLLCLLTAILASIIPGWAFAGTIHRFIERAAMALAKRVTQNSSSRQPASMPVPPNLELAMSTDVVEV